MEKIVTKAKECKSPRIPRLYTIIVLWSFVIVSISCSIKTGINTFQQESFEQYKSAVPPVALEFRIVKIGHSDISASLFYQTFDLEPNFSLADIDATWRYYPFEFNKFHPYIGGGAGYFTYRSKEIINTCPVGYTCIPGYDEDFRESNTTTLASGFNPHLLIGTYVPIGINDFELIFEVSHEFFKEDDPFNMNSTRFLIGIKWK